MSAVTHIKGRAVPVRGNDIDTDRIIPARFLRCVTFDGLGEHAFADDRAQLKEKGETHAFDKEEYAGANVLLVNANFGCGSSREHAPQSLAKWGIEAIVGISYAEIFFNNNIALGIPCIQVSPEEADGIQTAIESDPNLDVAINVETAEISYGASVIKGILHEGVRNRFLTGSWDATGMLVEAADEVAATAGKLPYMNGFQK